MNERQLYEKHLADKLQQLPPPADMNKSWEKMRLLLDDEMPRGGGFGRNRWWIGGIILIVLLAGTWLAGTQFMAKDKQNPSTVAATPNTANNQENPGAQDSPGITEKTNRPATNPSPGTGANSAKGTESAASEKAPDIKTGAANNPAVKEEPQHSLDAGNEHKANTAKKESTNEAGKTDVKSTETVNNDVAVDNNPVKQNTITTTGRGSKPKPSLAGNSTKTKSLTSIKNTGNRTKTNEELKPQARPLNPFTGDYLVDNTGAIIAPSGAINERYDAFTGAELFPHLANKKTASKSKSSYAGKVMADKSFAIGLSMPLGFAVGDQKPLSYNRNAGVNTVSDYIPAPNLQYHLNSKTYLQTELQFFAPQFIRPILLYQQKQAIPSSNDYIYNSVYAKKLYYFNLPVAIHHSPFKNFYLGTGVQFSTMLSGIALYEQVKRGPGTQDILMGEQYKRFSGDSLSNRFNGTEMRVLLDMNYYFNRFTVGLRYNQAVNNYVSFRLNSASPYVYDKNKALQFYLRYNLWEDIKRKKPAKSFLSLK